MEKKPKLSRRKKIARSHSAKYWGSKRSQLPEFLFHELVNGARNRTNISHTMSKAVVVIILSYLRDAVPSIKHVMQDILFQQDRVVPTEELDLTQDATTLRALLKKLDAMNNDETQRNHASKSDEAKVTEIICDIFDILLGADPEISKLVIAEDNYKNVETFITFYKSEPRAKIRKMMLRIFGRMCFIDNHVISVMSSSTLPAELARDILSDEEEHDQKFYYSCTVLTLILSIEEPLPVATYESFNIDFIELLLQLADTLLGTEEASKIFGLILACNLHFPVPEENAVLDALAKTKKVDFFFEEMFFLHSIKVDLVHFIPQKDSHDAVVKLLTDVFCRADTAKRMSTSKQLILIDLILTRLRATWKKNKLSTDYLTLFFNMLKTSNYKEHRHHQDDFRALFDEISAEDVQTEDVKKAKAIIKQIREEFPDLFPSSEEQA